MPLLVFDSENLPPIPVGTSQALPQSLDSTPQPPIPANVVSNRALQPAIAGPQSPMSSESLPPIPAVGAGTIADPENAAPVPPIYQPSADALAVTNKFLPIPNVDGVAVPPQVPATAPGTSAPIPLPLPQSSLALTGGSDGDQSVLNQNLTPGGTGASFFVIAPGNPPEVPVLPPPNPPFGFNDP